MQNNIPYGNRFLPETDVKEVAATSRNFSRGHRHRWGGQNGGKIVWAGGHSGRRPAAVHFLAGINAAPSQTGKRAPSFFPRC